MAVVSCVPLSNVNGSCCAVALIPPRRKKGHENKEGMKVFLPWKESFHLTEATAAFVHTGRGTDVTSSASAWAPLWRHWSHSSTWLSDPCRILTGMLQEASSSTHSVRMPAGSVGIQRQDRKQERENTSEPLFLLLLSLFFFFFFFKIFFYLFDISPLLCRPNAPERPDQ